MHTHSQTVLILGDSISAAYGLEIEHGWVSLAQQHIQQRQLSFNIINQSISGETSYGGLSRIESLLQQYQPTFVLIELGANDALHGVPTEVIQDNLRELILRSQQAGAETLVLGIHTANSYGETYRTSFCHIYQQLADEMGVALVPSILQEVINAGGMLQDDGLHPNLAAQTLISDKICRQLIPLLEKSS
ncbi:MAG: arylesterase [Cycloclasticus sp.]